MVESVEIGSVTEEWTPDEGEPSAWEAYVRVNATLTSYRVCAYRDISSVRESLDEIATLGNEIYVRYATREEAEGRAAEMQSDLADYDLDPRTRYSVSEETIAAKLGAVVGVPEWERGTVEAAGGGVVGPYLSVWESDTSDWQDVPRGLRDAVESALLRAKRRLWREAMAMRAEVRS